jgi:cytochrome c-type biogenesis protein CcmH/NrfG
MDVTKEQPKLWSSAQAYVLAIVCLFLGVILGYLLHPPKKALANVPQPEVVNRAVNAGMPSVDQLRHMADKKAEPLLAALEKNPNDAELMAQIASVYFRAQQFPVAVDYYERAARIRPTAEGLVSLSNSYHYAGADDRAIQALNDALKIDPKSANALFNLGMLDWQVKNDPKAAIASWQRLLKANPDHPRRAQVEAMIAKAKKHTNLPAGKKSDKPAM